MARVVDYLVAKQLCNMKLTANGIRMFVAGALCMDGLYALAWLLSHASSIHDVEPILSRMLGCLCFALGLGIFLGSLRVLRLTEIVLWVIVVGGLAGMTLYCCLNPSKAIHMIWRQGPGILPSIVLLSLMVWSRSPRFRQELDS